MDYKIKDHERAKILLQSLPNSYDHIIINLTKNIVYTKLVFKSVSTAIFYEESRWKNKGDVSTTSQQVKALAIIKGRWYQREPSRSNRAKSKSRSKKNIRHFGCGKMGHVKKECRNKKSEDKGKAPELSKQQNCVASTSSDSEALCMKRQQ